MKKDWKEGVIGQLLFGAIGVILLLILYWLMPLLAGLLIWAINSGGWLAIIAILLIILILK
jgi:hypothetical protein